jgi:predicted naringenin-chalcone synthase
MRPAAQITGAGHAFPARVSQEALWDGYFADYFRGNRVAERIFRATRVDHRHAAVDPVREDIATWTTGARMTRYLTEAVPLGATAVAAALKDAGLAAGDVGLLAVASCTGYATPGIDIRLAGDLGMAPDTQRVFVGHMGCYAALPAMGVIGDFVVARERPAVLLCVELTSLHLQPANGEPQQAVVHALFGDAASAIVVEPTEDRICEPAPLRLVDIVAVTDPTTSDHMTWDITDHGFRMGLSPKVPDVLARHVGALVGDLLAKHGLGVADVPHWVVHPGGPRILSTVADCLHLPAAALAASEKVLAEYGNCSSATVLLVLDEIRRSGAVAPGDHVVGIAFGPGLTLYACLWQAQPA